MEPPRQERAPTFGEEFDLLFMEFMKSDAPYEQCRRELLKLEKRWLKKAKTPARLRRENPLRKEHMEAIAHAKKVARVPSLPSPGPP